MGAGVPKAIRRAAKMGLSFACVGGRKEMGIYTEALKEAGRNPADFSLVNSRVVYIAATAQQAWKEVGDALMYQAQHYGKWLSAAAGTSDMSQVLIRPDPERLKRTSILGPPEEVRARITAIIESGPITDLITVAQLPGLDPAKARRSLERFGREVLPAFK